MCLPPGQAAHIIFVFVHSINLMSDTFHVLYMITSCSSKASISLRAACCAAEGHIGICGLQSADDACEHAAGRMHDLEIEIRELRARHAEQINQMQHQQTR